MQLPTGYKTYLSFYDFIKKEIPDLANKSDYEIIGFAYETGYDNQGNVKKNEIKFSLMELRSACFNEIDKHRPEASHVVRIEEVYFIHGGVNPPYTGDKKFFNGLFELSVK